MKNPGYVLITGAGSGLGRSLAIKFARNNFPVVLVGRSKSKLDSVSNEFGQEISISIEADISQEDEVKRVFEAAREWGGKPYAVISCAGEGVFGKAGTFSENDIERVLSANLIGTILVSQEALTEMRGEEGFIVNIMSTAAFTPRVNESIYCAAKWGAKGFTDSLRLEVKGTKIKVLGVFPGGMQTPFWGEKSGMNPDTSGFMNPDEVAQTIIDNILGKNSLYVSDIILNRL